MDLVTIWKRSNWEFFINYDRKEVNIPEDTEILTMKEITKEKLEKIKNETYEWFQKILSEYI